MIQDTAEHRVLYAETDQMGAVYNAHFLTYFEIGRTEYLRRRGIAYRELETRGVYLVVVEAHCRYQRPARYDDVLEIQTWVGRLRPTRIDFRHRVLRQSDGTRIAEGHMVLACIDADRKPRPLPRDVRDLIDVIPAPQASG